MNELRCPSGADLERGFFARDPALRAHADRCPACGGELSRIADVAALARSIGAPASTEERREQLRTLLTSQSRPAPKRSRGWMLASSAVFLIALVLGRSQIADRSRIADRPLHRARIEALAPSRYWTASAQPDEIVRIIEGAIRIDVSPLGAGERFRVATGDAEVEVHGTRFEVRAKADRLEAVSVLEGLVVVRAGAGEVELRAGGRWPATPSKASNERADDSATAIADAPAKPPPRRARKTAVTPPLLEAPHADAYEAAWSALRANDFETAAAGFTKVLEEEETGALRVEAGGAGAESPRRPETADPALREDARYFLAVSLARAGHRERAIVALEHFLREHSSSPRSGEAAAMLGWMLYDEGDDTRAAALFDRALGSGSARAERSAKDGLEAIRRRSHAR